MEGISNKKNIRVPVDKQLNYQSASTSSTGRSKVMLKPGRSLMDWVRLTHSGKDLAGTGGKCLEISHRELAKHNTPKDAWIALRGRVYNVTHYLEYHPGGEDELMRGIGTDATDLFNEVHRWVNAESMLEKCFIGLLKRSWTLDEKVSNFKPLRYLKLKHKNPEAIPDNIDQKIRKSENQDELKSHEKSEWPGSPLDSEIEDIDFRYTEDGNFMKVKISCPHIKKYGLITDLVGRKLLIKYKNHCESFLSIDVPVVYKGDYEVELTEENLGVLLTIDDNTIRHSSNAIIPVSWGLNKLKHKDIYWPCQLIKKSQVNHNTFLYTFRLPHGTKMWIPLGCHVQIKSNIEGLEVVRRYTPVSSSLNSKMEQEDIIEASLIVFMIKIYPKGKMTQLLNQCSIGDSLCISHFTGNFSEELIKNCDKIVMLAAGTGITPMVRIIIWVTLATDKKRSMSLLFFNKTEEDILWQEELNICKASYEDFQVTHILSEPNDKWNGMTGEICEDLFNALLSVKDPSTSRRILICGPLAFTESALRYLERYGTNPEEIYAFTGS